MPPAAPPPQPGRVARAATRYRPGKAPVGAQDLLDSDSEEEERQDEREKHEEEEAPQSITSINFAKPRQTAGIVIQQQQGSERTRKLDLLLDQKRSTAGRKGEEEEGEESSEYETDTDEEPQKPVFRPQGARNLPKVGVTAKVEEEASSEYETDSEEESSEEEVKPMLKPLFVPKSQRKTVNALEDEQKVAEIAESKAEKEAEIRRKEAHLLAADRIKRELLEKQHEESKPDLDDTDGKDPEEEFQAWRLRELERINRDREAAAERQREKEEIEKRREMPEEQKLREDMERAKKSREEKSRGKQGFMQRYYHKGAFYQDLDILKKHDYTEKTENAIDYSLLPKSMQVKNFGRASRSKYTHLAAEDTSKPQGDPRFAGLAGASSSRSNLAARGSSDGGGKSRGGGEGCFNCGGEHMKRDCPEGLRGGGRSGGGGTGTNAQPVSDRTDRVSDDRGGYRGSWDDREGGREKDRYGRGPQGGRGPDRPPYHSVDDRMRRDRDGSREREGKKERERERRDESERKRNSDRGDRHLDDRREDSRDRDRYGERGGGDVRARGHESWSGNRREDRDRPRLGDGRRQDGSKDRERERDRRR